MWRNLKKGESLKSWKKSIQAAKNTYMVKETKYREKLSWKWERGKFAKRFFGNHQNEKSPSLLQHSQLI